MTRQYISNFVDRYKMLTKEGGRVQIEFCEGLNQQRVTATQPAQHRDGS